MNVYNKIIKLYVNELVILVMIICCQLVNLTNFRVRIVRQEIIFLMLVTQILLKLEKITNLLWSNPKSESCICSKFCLSQKLECNFDQNNRTKCFFFIKIGVKYNFVENSEIGPDSETFTVVMPENQWSWVSNPKHPRLEGEDP